MVSFRTIRAPAAMLLGFGFFSLTYGYKLSPPSLAANDDDEQPTAGSKNQTVAIALCGSNNNGPTDTVEMYSLTSNSRVKSGASAPDRRDAAATAIFNNTIYVVGGFTGVGYEDTFWSYDVAKNQWNNNLPNAPSAVFDSAAVEVGGRMYILGGTTDFSENLTQVYAYETRLRKWYRLETPIPQTSQFPCAVAHDQHLYYMPEGRLYRSVDGADTWKELMVPNERTRSEAACVAVGNDAILLAGGLNAEMKVLNSVEIYNITTNRWKTVAPMKMARNGGSAELLVPGGNNVLVCGGMKGNDDSTILKTCEVYDWNKNEWSNANYEMDQPRVYFGLFVTQAEV